MNKVRYFAAFPFEGKHNKYIKKKRELHCEIFGYSNFREVTGFGGGYVILPKGHPFHGMPYTTINGLFSAYPELTFSQFVSKESSSYNFFKKYIPKKIKDYIKENDEVFVIGFHTAGYNHGDFKKKGTIIKTAKYMAEALELYWMIGDPSAFEKPNNRKERRAFYYQSAIIKPFDMSSL